MGEDGDCGERFGYDLETELTELAGRLDVESEGKTGVARGEIRTSI